MIKGLKELIALRQKVEKTLPWFDSLTTANPEGFVKSGKLYQDEEEAMFATTPEGRATESIMDEFDKRMGFD